MKRGPNSKSFENPKMSRYSPQQNTSNYDTAGGNQWYHQDSACTSNAGRPPPAAAVAVRNTNEPAHVSKRSKKKSMSSRLGGQKKWLREDAVKALELEKEYLKKTENAPILLLRFPDPELNRSIVGNYSPHIDSVHFQLNSAPRFCFVHLKAGADVEKTIKEISEIPFGTGFVSAEVRRTTPAAVNVSNPDEIDPHTLYIGNLTNTISTRTVKEHFPGATRVDIGFAQRMKGTRYAFVRYDSVDKAMEDFKRSVNSTIESRSLIVRFLRKKNQFNSAAANKSGTNEPEEAPLISDKSPAPPSASTTANVDIEPRASMNEIGNEHCVDSKENILGSLGNTVFANQLAAATGANITPKNLLENSIHIKEEITETEFDLSEEEGLPNLLGARYCANVDMIKTEVENASPEACATTINYDDEFGASEEDEDNWSMSTKPSNMPRKAMQLLGGPKKTDCVDTKPNVEQLQKAMENNTENDPEHSSFVKKLYEQRAKETEYGERTRDELDHLFAQMNSDSEDNDDFL